MRVTWLLWSTEPYSLLGNKLKMVKAECILFLLT